MRSSQSHSRSVRQAHAQTVLKMLEQGYYDLGGETIPIHPTRSVAGTRVILAEDEAPKGSPGPAPLPLLHVVDATSTEAVRQAPPGHTAVLNFASGTRPGGGFLTGSLAQEEDLCRSSTLYAALSSPAALPFYEAGRAADHWGADALVYTPDVEFFLDGQGQPTTIRRADVMTCAAPNLRPFPGDSTLQQQSGEYLTRRGQMILRAAEAAGVSHLILGAWGCGVFANDPEVVAGALLSAIDAHRSKREAGILREIVFAIPAARTAPPPGVKDNLTTFREVVGGRR